MSPINIIRAWKDADYRQSLSAAELAALPAHPAGLIELSDDELEGAAGGAPGLPSVPIERCQLPSYDPLTCQTKGPFFCKPARGAVNVLPVIRR